MEWILTALALLLIAPYAIEGQADPLVVVVNRVNFAASGLNKNDVKKILLGDRLSWPNGAKITIIFRPAGNADRAAALRGICGMGESEYTRHQMQAGFTGGATAVIREVATDGEVKAALKSNPWGIAFLRKKDVDDSLKTVFALE